MRYLLFSIAAAAWAKDPILFSFFRNNGEDGLYLAASHDGLKWRVLNQNQPLVGAVIISGGSAARDGVYGAGVSVAGVAVKFSATMGPIHALAPG